MTSIKPTAKKIKAPTRAASNYVKWMLPAEVERLAWMVRTMPMSGFYNSVSESTGEVRRVLHPEAQYILSARGI